MFDDLQLVDDAASVRRHVVDSRHVEQLVEVGRIEVRIQAKHTELALGHARVRPGTVQLVVRRTDSTDVYV